MVTHSDKIASLIVGIMHEHDDIVACLARLTGVQAYIARRLTPLDRMQFAECLRDVADSVEHQNEPVLVR